MSDDERTYLGLVEHIDSLSDEERVIEFGNMFIALWEVEKGQKVAEADKDYLMANAKTLVYLEGGNRNSEELIQGGMKFVNSYTSLSFSSILYDLFGILGGGGDRMVRTTAEMATNTTAKAKEAIKEYIGYDYLVTVFTLSLAFGITVPLLTSYLIGRNRE